MRLVPMLAAVWLCFSFITDGQDTDLKRRTPESEAAKSRLERRTTLDIEVTDPAGKAVHGLPQNAFVLNDNGERKPLTSFLEIDGRTVQPPVEAILLLDTMNATFEDVGIMRQGIDAFLRQDGGRLPFPVSIVFLTDTGIKLNKPSINGLELAKDFSKIQTPIRVLGPAQGAGGAMDRAQRSLHALQMLSAYEGSRPGRKLVLWLGPGWPLLAETRTSAPSAENARRYYSSIVDTTTQLRRAHITLYSVAPLNLSHGDPQSAFLYQQYLKGVTMPAQADSPNLGVQVLATHSGGLVLNKSGDLPGQINRCLADGNSYYEVTFDAEPGDEAGVYRSIQVTVGRPGTAARTITAYYAGQTQLTGAPTQTAAIVQSPAAGEPLIRAQTRLVVLDVTVLDKNGRPIVGLKPADLQLLDDGHPQKLASFEEHTGAPGGNPPAIELPAPGTPIAIGNKPPDGSIWNIIAVDLINTPKEEWGHLQQQLEDFAREFPAGTPVALVSMAGGLKVLSSFTDGQAGFVRALKKGIGPISVGGPANIVERGEIAQNIDIGGDSLRHKAEVDVERQAQRAQMTLDDFASMARWLKTYPGKKNVFWLSSGFPIEGKPFGSAGYGSLAGASANQKLPMQDKTDKELEAARIAIYPIDSRGVVVADIAGETNADTAGDCAKCQVINAEKDSDLKAGQQSEMLEIARATGGVARFNNDLAKSLVQGFREGESYYTLSYIPPDGAWDGRYHRFRLELDRPGVQLVYRQGYYARDPETAPPPTADDFKAALETGQPAVTSVLFTVNVLPNADSVELRYAIDRSTVRFTQAPDGKLLADLDCAVVEFNAKDKILEKSLIRLSETIGPDQSQALPGMALNGKQTIVLKTGATNLVIGVRDRATGQYGTLRVGIPGR